MMIDEIENVILQLLFERVTPCLGIKAAVVSEVFQLSF